MADAPKAAAPPQTDEPHRCGVIAIIGAPNAGKSTLVNALVGAKVTIVSHKVQTTRAPLRGITLHVARILDCRIEKLLSLEPWIHIMWTISKRGRSYNAGCRPGSRRRTWRFGLRGHPNQSERAERFDSH